MSTTVRSHKTIEEVEKQFKAWRKTRKRCKPIPAELWKAAASLTADYSIPTIAKRLILDPAELKRRVPAACAHQSNPQHQTAPAFIELEIGSHGINYECTIEMEGKKGVKMRIHIKDARIQDLSALCESLWRERS